MFKASENVWLRFEILHFTCKLNLALSREALLGSAGFFEGRVASFEVAGTLARFSGGLGPYLLLPWSIRRSHRFDARKVSLGGSETVKFVASARR